MRIFLTGPSCVGKTTIGKKVGELLELSFFDLDFEIENFFGTSIERLQNQFLTIQLFRAEAAKALEHLLNRPESRNSVIALSPAGLLGGYWRIIKRVCGITVVLTDTPENLLKKIRFYDIDTQPIEVELTDEDKRYYLREIKLDNTYFKTSYKRANLQVDISGLDPDQAARKVIEVVEEYILEKGSDPLSKSPMYPQ
ncbi:MAG: hypothetical protein ISR78_02065 [Spirochaetia bacterium]|nr:hypothetical protein [Spirochaetia bacterium]